MEEEEAADRQWVTQAEGGQYPGHVPPYQPRHRQTMNQNQAQPQNQGVAQIQQVAGEVGTQLKSLWGTVSQRVSGSGFGRGGAGNGVQPNGTVGHPPQSGQQGAELRQQFNDVAEGMQGAVDDIRPYLADLEHSW